MYTKRTAGLGIFHLLYQFLEVGLLCNNSILAYMK